MKRPSINAVFSPVNSSTRDTARKLLALVVGDLKGYLVQYYARVRHDPETDSYMRFEERLQLDGEREFLRRIDQDSNSMCCIMVGLGFDPAEIYIAIFSDIRKPSETTVLLSIDPEITRTVETQEYTRPRFAVFLARVAKSIEADWFVAGPHMYEWRPLDITRTLDDADLGKPYVVGWKAGFSRESKIVEDLNIEKDKIFKTTAKYNFADRFPDYYLKG